MMTPEQINVLVAKKVMDGIFPNDPDKLGHVEEVWYYVKREKLLRGEPSLLNGDHPEEERAYDHSWKEWNPAGDIAAAWQVVEKMRSLGWMPRIVQPSPNYETWSVRFTPYPNTVAYQYAESENVRLAICLAALRAVGVEVEGEE